jgi:hypothetical protein
MMAERPAYVTISTLLCPKGVVVELKREVVEGKGGGRLATILWPIDHVFPRLNPYFHPPLHLAPIMLTQLIKSIKSKANFFHPFPKFFLFIFEIFRFYIIQ